MGLLVAIAIQLIESSLSSMRKPSFSLLIILINFMMEKKTKYKTPKLQKKHWIECNRTYGLLKDILYLFGPSIFDEVWDQFRFFRLDRLPKDRSVNEQDEISELDSKQLNKYDDLWAYIDHTLNNAINDLEGRCHKLVLKLLIEVLDADLKYCMENEKKVPQSILLRTLKRDAIGRYCKFDSYTDIIFSQFPREDPFLLQMIVNYTLMF